MRVFSSRIFSGFVAALLFSNIAMCQAPAPQAPTSAVGRFDPNSPGSIGRTEVVQYLDTLAARDTGIRRTSIAAISTRAEAEARQQAVRTKVLALIGGLPERTPLHAQSFGATQAGGFRIEKVLFDSQPGFHVTALLYIPDGGSVGQKFPAILMTPGHYPPGKAADYVTAATFARNGFVVLSYDPIGQGERLQYPDPVNAGTSLATRPTGEHGEASLQPMLIGDAIARYFVWDAMRGIDYLSTRPEVDPRRIGALGCSGGGAVSALTGALDARVAAIGVACYTTSFDTLLPALGPQDGEQSIPNFIAAGLDFPDWIELAAPRPYAVIATYSDMFPFAGTRSTVMEARRFYALFDHTAEGAPVSGAPQSMPPTPTGPALNVDTTHIVARSAPLQFITGPGRHGALGPMLGNIVGFFIQNLEPGADPMHPILPPLRPDGAGDRLAALAALPRGALQVTPTGQVATSYPGSETVFTLNRKRAAKVIPANRPLLSRDDLSAAIRKTTGITTGDGACKAEIGPMEHHVGHLVLHCDEGIELHGEIAVPASTGRHSAVMLLVPDSIDADSVIARANKAQFEHLAATGNLVLAITPRPSPPGTDDMKSPILGPFYLLSLRADLVGKTLTGMRVEDVFHIMNYLAHRPDVDPTRITATGSGHMGLVLLYAATLDAGIQHVTVDHVLASYQSLLDAPLPIGAPEDIIPGVLRYCDIPNLTTSLGSRLTEASPLQGVDDLSQAEIGLREP